MGLVDINKVQKDAETEVRQEREADAKQRLKAQMKTVEDCKTALRNEENKLQDILTAIADGN